MIKQLARLILLLVCLVSTSQVVFAQKGKKKAKTATRAKKTRTAKNKTTANVRNGEATGDATTQAAAAPANDSLPIKKVPKSLRRDAAVDDDAIKDRTPLAYEHLRAEDAVYRHKIWREIDAREKINLPFRYAADENNGNQRFIMILLKAIQDDAITVFNSIDDRFTTPMTKAEVAAVVAGDEVTFDVYDANGNVTGKQTKRNEVNWDSIYKFRIKEEVVFDKESSRLFFRILGIAPVKRLIVGSTGIDMGDLELFWVYYPDMRETFAKYEVYNGKNYGARMSWEELFESRMFNGRIIKSTIDNPYDLYIKNYKGLQENTILQLFEGENIKEKIFNYEQDLWAY
jgi:gliding motility associated protien GldN